MSVISLRIPNEEKQLIESYAKLQGMSVSEVFRRSVLEKIEEEYDLRVYDEAWADYLASGKKSYTLEEAKKELGFE